MVMTAECSYFNGPLSYLVSDYNSVKKCDFSLGLGASNFIVDCFKVLTVLSEDSSLCVLKIKSLRC